MNLSALSDSMKTIAVANHITKVNYSVAGFKDGLSLQAYSGKRLRLHEDPAVKGSFSINDSKVLETVMTCKDGVIHHIDKWLDLKTYDFRLSGTVAIHLAARDRRFVHRYRVR